MDSFIALPIKERELLLTEAAKRHGRMDAKILEKDFWVCWMLKRLFDITEIAPYLTFKGGTSLSKAYGLIDRFSEDIDLTIDKEYLGIHIADWPDDNSSRKARQEFRKMLDTVCGKVIAGQLLPLLKKKCLPLLGNADWDMTIAENDPLTILFRYPRVVSYGGAFSMGFSDAFSRGDSGYIKPVIRLEFGARGDGFPTAPHSFIPYIAEILPDIFDNPAGINVTVTTLEAERTFWEKVSILHDLYHKDSHKLARKGIAAKAVGKRNLLEAVVRNSRLNCTDSNDSLTYKAYDDLLQHRIKLIPSPAHSDRLEKDYADMQESGMFFGDFPGFEEIVEELVELERMLNLTGAKSHT